MNVTGVQIVLPWGGPPQLLAYCSIELDHCLIVHGLRLIQGTSKPFVAMPSKKMGNRCQGCRAENAFDAKFCSRCGAPRTDHTVPLTDIPREKKFADIVHPIDSATREMISNAIIAEYERTIAGAGTPAPVPNG